MSDFFRNRKCSVCGRPATRAHFGLFLCDSEECLCTARDTKECAGKTMGPGPVSAKDLMKKGKL
jgi:hypothetical protein